MTAGLWCLEQLTPTAVRVARGARRAPGRRPRRRRARRGRRAAGERVRIAADAVLHRPAGARLSSRRPSANTDHYAAFFRGMLDARRLSAAVTVRGVVPLGGAHGEGCGPDDCGGEGGDAGRREARKGTEGTRTQRSSLFARSDLRVLRARLCLTSPKRQRRIQPHAQHRSRRQLDVLPFGRRDRAAAADQDAGERALRRRRGCAPMIAPTPAPAPIFPVSP